MRVGRVAERDADTAGFIAIELEGDLTGDVDLDADAGALLIRPTRVVGALPFDHTMTHGRVSAPPGG